MNELEENIINLYADKGKQWLADLPQLVLHLKVTHGLSNLNPFKHLSYHYVLSGFQGMQPIVLKLGLDTHTLKREAAALKAFAGFGVVKVLADSEGMLLLEGAVSGLSLRSYFSDRDQEAIDITCECLKQLHQAPIPSDHRLPHIKDWLLALDKALDIPTDYLHKARRLRDELIATIATPTLLHGDLYHDNILQHAKSWLVIDPKGVIGEPAYDIAAFIRNPIPDLLDHHHVSSIIDKRINEFAQTLKLSQQRIINWCYVQAVLAWGWALEDNCDETYFKKLTELFNRYL